MKTVLSIVGVSLLLSALDGCAANKPPVKDLVTVPENQAVALAQAKIPGQLVQTKLAQVGDRYIYQIQIRDQNDTNWWVQVDASDGSMIERQTRPRLKY